MQAVQGRNAGGAQIPPLPPRVAGWWGMAAASAQPPFPCSPTSLQASELEGLDPEFLVQPGEEHGAAAAAEAARVERARRSVVEAEADALLSLLGRRGFQVQGGEDAALASLQATDASEAGVTPVPAADRHGAGEAGLHAEGEADRHAAGGAAGQATAVKAPSVEPAEADVAAPSPGGRLP